METGLGGDPPGDQRDRVIADIAEPIGRGDQRRAGRVGRRGRGGPDRPGAQPRRVLQPVEPHRIGGHAQGGADQQEILRGQDRPAGIKDVAQHRPAQPVQQPLVQDGEVRRRIAGMQPVIGQHAPARPKLRRRGEQVFRHRDAVVAGRHDRGDAVQPDISHAQAHPARTTHARRRGGSGTPADPRPPRGAVLAARGACLADAGPGGVAEG